MTYLINYGSDAKSELRQQFYDFRKGNCGCDDGVGFFILFVLVIEPDCANAEAN